MCVCVWGGCDLREGGGGNKGAVFLSACVLSTGCAGSSLGREGKACLIEFVQVGRA